MPERERNNIFNGVLLTLIAAVWYSNRERRKWVDDELDSHSKLILGAEQRAAARRGMVQAVVTIAGIIVAVATAYSLLH